MTGRKILLLNLLILAGILVCTQQLISGWQRFEASQNLDQVMRDLLSKPNLVTEESSDLVAQAELQHDFLVITDRDLFRPDRRPESVDEAEAGPETAPEFPKKPKMSGVTERDGQRLALLTIFNTPKGSGETSEVGLGAVVQGYVVTEITDTTLTLTWNDQNVIVDMLDSEPSPTKKIAPPGKQAASLNIIRIGSKVAAVETTSPEAPKEEARGLQVGVVGNQQTGATRGRSGLAGGRGVAGRGGMSGRAGSGLGRGSQGLGSTIGGMGRPGNTRPPNQRY